MELLTCTDFSLKALLNPKRHSRRLKSIFWQSELEQFAAVLLSICILLPFTIRMFYMLDRKPPVVYPLDKLYNQHLHPLTSHGLLRPGLLHSER